MGHHDPMRFQLASGFSYEDGGILSVMPIGSGISIYGSFATIGDLKTLRSAGRHAKSGSWRHPPLWANGHSEVEAGRAIRGSDISYYR